jgi:hypothetical protein
LTMRSTRDRRRLTLLLDHALDTTVDVAWWPDGVNAFKHDELDTFWILAIIDLAFLFIVVIVTTAKVLQRTNLVTTHTHTHTHTHTTKRFCLDSVALHTPSLVSVPITAVC